MITFPAVSYHRFHFFVVTHITFFYSSSIQNLKLVFVISYFYKTLVQFSSHLIELILKQFFSNSVLVLDRLE